jgi:hypothetical protein
MNVGGIFNGTCPNMPRKSPFKVHNLAVQSLEAEITNVLPLRDTTSRLTTASECACHEAIRGGEDSGVSSILAMRCVVDQTYL